MPFARAFGIAPTRFDFSLKYCRADRLDIHTLPVPARSVAVQMHVFAKLAARPLHRDRVHRGTSLKFLEQDGGTE